MHKHFVPIYALTAVWVVSAVGSVSQSAPKPPIKKVTAADGLTGGGTGPNVTVGIAPRGVTGAHVALGTLTLENFAQSAKDGLKGEPGADGAPGAAGPQGLQGQQGPQGAAGEGALTDGPGAGGLLTEFAQEGGVAPGGTFSEISRFTNQQRDRWLFNRQGQQVFAAAVDTDNDGGGDVSGIFVAGPNGTVCVVKSGDTLPDGSLADNVSPVLLTDSGKLYFTVRTIPQLYPGKDTTALYGWDGNQVFTVIGQSSTATDGSVLYLHGFGQERPWFVWTTGADQIGFSAIANKDGTERLIFLKYGAP